MSEELEVFTLPDGGKVKCGNIVPESLPRAYAEMDENDFLEKKDIEKLVKADDYLEKRKRFAQWVIHQSTVGKCNTSAAVGGLYRVRHKSGQKHVPLADNHLYWRISGGGDNGSLLKDGMDVVRDGGVSPRIIQVGGKDYRIPDLVYNRGQLPAGVAQEADKQGKRFKFWEPRRLPEDYETFKIAVASALARDYPIVFAWHVGNNSMRLNNGYVVQGRGPGNHANFWHGAKWVGGSDIVHPDDCNSWGPTADPIYGPMGSGWGEGGFGLFTMESAFQCRGYHDFYVIVSCNEDSDDSIL